MSTVGEMNLLHIPYVAADDSVVPKAGTPASAGYDLVSTEEATLAPGTRKLINAGFSMALPEGFAGLVCPRSGLALKHGITVLNAPGIIDSDYTGSVGVILMNLGDKPFEVKKGDRVAQLVVVKHEFLTFHKAEKLDETVRNAGGFGHTGI
jgi:dUTP pyrophosphatase